MVNRHTFQPAHFRFTPFQSDYRPPYGSPDSRNDETNTNRKRIAVACGRCRKRKIRCSGDNGNGEPCVNCRNANASPCQFLRVSSLETNLKDNGRPSQAFPYEGYSRSYPSACVDEARARLASQSAAPLPSMYQETGSPTWTQDPISPTPYRAGQSSPDRTYSWTTGGYYCQLPETDASSPSNYNGMYAQAQDVRYQLSSFEMAPMKHFSYLNSDPGSYTFPPQPTAAMATTATLVDRCAVGSGSNYPLNTVPHGLLPSLMADKLHLNDTASSNDQNIGTKVEPLGAINAYTKSSPSSTSSLQPLTPSTTYGSYTASPGSAYSGMIPATQGESHSYNGLVEASTSLPTQFPPPPTSTYVYTDMSAQAAAIAASGRRMTQAGSSPAAQYHAQQNCYPDGLSEVERKPPTMH